MSSSHKGKKAKMDEKGEEEKGQEVETKMQKSQEDLKNIPACWAENIERVLFTSDEIQEKVKELAAIISRDYAGKEVLCVGLLTGAFVFVSDLLRRLTVPYMVDFMVVSSYGSGTSSSGSVKLKKDMSIDPKGKHVLVLEDLIDTGGTLEWVMNHLKGKDAASVKLCCLLDKKARRNADVKIDYTGWECPDYFIVGYGMDFADTYRCLPFVGVLAPKCYT